MSAIRVVFLDDGGVLNDNERRAPEWERLLGEFLSPRFGGTPQAWGEANHAVYGGLWDEWWKALAGGIELSPDWWPLQDHRWLTGMFDRVGVAWPADIPGTTRAARAHVMKYIDCAYPEAADAVRAIRALGLTVHTASGGLSYELAPYFERMGIRDLFDRLYGPDLIGVHKNSVHYYERIVEDSGVDPRTSVIVDSHAEPLEWADAVGFRTVHVDRRGTGSRFTRISSLDRLLPLLEG